MSNGFTFVGYQIIVNEFSGVDTIPVAFQPDGEVDLSVGETVIITGDASLGHPGLIGGPPTDFGDGIGTAAEGTYGATDPGLGTLAIDGTDGTFSWTITQADWVAAGSPSRASFSITHTGSGTSGTRPVSLTLTCFSEGTSIATPNGQALVEDLRIGDAVLTADGACVPVRWVGRQTVNTVFTPDERLWPVEIKAGALGDGIPNADLTVTGDHGMIIDGYVINASALVNGNTIRFVPLAEQPASRIYYHIETEAHDVILANGAPAETFLDTAGRSVFDNHQEYLELYGAERILPEMNCQRISSRRLVPTEIKERLCLSEESNEATQSACA